MKNCFGLLFAFSLLLSFPGCGGHEGGTVTENTEQSAIEAYQAAEEASRAEMSGMDVATEGGAAPATKTVTPE